MKYLIFLASLIYSLNALASIDTQGITFSGGQVGTSNYGGNSTLYVSHGPAGYGYSAVMFNYAPASGIIQGSGYGTTPATLTPTNMTVDIGADLFFASPGQEFSVATIASGSFPLLVASTNTGFTGFGTVYALPSSGVNPYPGLLFQDTGIFYLGVNSGQNIFSPAFDRSIFGWAEFSYNPSGIQLISSAVTYDQAGIFIGTTNTVSTIPIPTAVWLFSSGLLGLIGVARKHNAI